MNVPIGEQQELRAAARHGRGAPLSACGVPPKVTADLLDALYDELFPICRSITGPGLRQSLDILGRHMPLQRGRVASGTEVFDWTVPPEWHLRSARLTAPDGRVVADASVSNLQVVNYAEAVDRHLSLAELRPHLHGIPDLPQAVPYVTSYYRRTWGFCLPQAEIDRLPEGRYHARIDSNFVDGGVDFAQALLPGEQKTEILLTSYLCHPSMANNELSGPLVLLGLYLRLAAWKRRRFSYRFVLAPETIGSLCYLYRHGDDLKRNLAAGLVLTCLGGAGQGLKYKLSRRGDGLFDAVARSQGMPLTVRSYHPGSGSDERQYCSPGFNLPVGQMSRATYGTYAGYHNSLDDKDFMGIDTLMRSINELEDFLATAEIAGFFRNLSPHGEPQLGKRGLYPNMNSEATRGHSNDIEVDGRAFLDRLLFVLSYSDGVHSIAEIAEMCGCTLRDLKPVVERLEDAGLLALDPAVAGPERYDQGQWRE